MLVLDNGDVIITLSDTAYLRVSQGTVALMADKNPAPLMMLYPDPDLFQNIRAQLEEQGNTVEAAIDTRQDWVSWVGWTSAMLPSIAGDKQELKNLKDLYQRLHTAYDRLGDPPKGSTAAPAPNPDDVELFIGCRLLADNRITLRDDKGVWVTTDGDTLHLTPTDSRPCPPAFAAALHSILVKLDTDNNAEIKQDMNDLQTQATDLQTLQKDMSEYQSLQAQNGSSYEVDYGTEEISASDAISRTQKDIDQNATDTKALRTAIEKELKLQVRIPTLMQRFKSGK